MMFMIFMQHGMFRENPFIQTSPGRKFTETDTRKWWQHKTSFTYKIRYFHTGYVLDDWGLFRYRSKDSSLRHRVQTSSGSNQVSCTVCTGGYFPRDEASGA